MQENDALFLGHMLDTAQSVMAKVKGVSREQFDQDEILRLALVHQIQIIGEAARRVSDQIQTAHPEIPWKQIIGMRHKVVHDYLQVDEDIVWEVATADLPTLVRQLEQIVDAK